MSRDVGVVVADPGSADRVRQALGSALGDGPALAVLPSGPPAWQQVIRAAVLPARPVDGAVVLPTSGSTGPPVGVVLSAEAVRWSALRLVERLGGPGGWLLALPVTHVAGLMVLARSMLSDSAVAATSGRFAAAAFAAAAARLPAGRRYTALVPTQLHRLLADDPATLAGFDAVLVGGAAMAPRLRDRARAAGVPVVESYGMTETCGGCVLDGVPLPGVQVRAEERVTLSGPMLATSYRRVTADAPVAPQGWFTTNDAGRWVDGRLSVLGRMDDVVLTGGVSVSLPLVDALLLEHPDLADAAAVGLPDEEWGTRVVAVAVARDGARPDTEAVRSFLARRAHPATVPRDLVLVDDLARPAPGKVDRRALARMVEER